tara:strand:- start:57 stop:596 length:540 start_codon:yes stop_codon:yes gene_type:complete
MSSTQFTKVVNTAVQGSVLESELDGNDLRALLMKSVKERNESWLTANTTLDEDHLVDASIYPQGILVAPMLALTVHSDSPSLAANYINLFGLNSSLTQRKVLNFTLTSVAAIGSSVTLNNASGTASSIVFSTGGAAVSSTLNIFSVSSVSPPGTTLPVTVHATATASGTERVVFTSFSE